MMTTRDTPEATRRALVLQGSAAAATAALALQRFTGLTQALEMAFPGRPGEEVLPWADQPGPNPVPQAVGGLLRWEDLNSYLTPAGRHFTVVHYGQPDVDAQAWRLGVGGLVERPLSLTLDELRARPRQEVVFTLECSGNHGFPWSGGLISTARWAGTPLAPVLAEAGVQAGGREVVFWGADAGEETVRGVAMPQHFARSMSLADATDSNVLLAYEMNGAPLPAAHGAPLRLIAPGWYGVANVKWLTRVEVRETRLMTRYMARDYVTLREEPPAAPGAEPVWVETSVGRARLKSVPARVTRLGGQHRIMGAAWGAPIAGVEVQIDGGPWAPAALDRTPGEDAPFAWRLWALDWGAPAPGEHAVTSRATDTAGHVQPAPDDPWMTGNKADWEFTGQV
ncbi:MAG TPA: sulfite oxidase, partial [Chloroflexota bacterium]|nr:sulfite oxidase [Chloroflexota bacterium]